MSDQDRGRSAAVLERPRSSPRVDPRLRARRIEVRRREGRRRLRRLLVALSVTLLCAAAWGVSRSALLDVDHVEVLGISRLDDDTVRAAGGIARGEPLVDLDLGAARRQVAELSWVESVELTRSWWGTVRYEVVERRPAVVVAGEPAMLVDGSGWVLGEATPPDRASLPLLVGVAAPEPRRQLAGIERRAVEVAAALSPDLARWISAVEVDDDELWFEVHDDALEAAGGSRGEHPARVRLGDARDLSGQLTAAETILHRVDLRCLAMIDARIASSAVVTRDEACDEGLA